ncbi:hypothetical protein [Liquorilactobacillus capillatus]|uniref:Uncharacterized protein n=1 Tax=Liquorilactobacillus capillatus DSM 19910 TaxID=1423731 RepID=A0A0R1M9C9_9LACO|nr:hypothetical protein [Liquorilactobacillus capillatus]KRL02388.1 hypothetical protein FC81_GL000732 [Liquorilactobacillus capillatus DSM 19910]
MAELPSKQVILNVTDEENYLKPSIISEDECAYQNQVGENKARNPLAIFSLKEDQYNIGRDCPFSIQKLLIATLFRNGRNINLDSV